MRMHQYVIPTIISGMVVLLMLTGCGNGDDRQANGDGAAQAAGGAIAQDRECPPELSQAALPADGPADDVIGIRPGMSFNDVMAILQCREGMKTFDVAETWAVSETFGTTTRQLLRVTDGVACEQRSTWMGSGDACDTAGNRFSPLKEFTEEFVVAFTGLPDEEVVRAVWRRTIFSDDAYPAIESLVNGLQEKYGEPVHQMSGDYLRTYYGRHAGHRLAWYYSPAGQRFTQERDFMGRAFQRDCTGMRPNFDGRQSWNSGCGLTIVAEVLPLQGSRHQARSMEIMIADQAALYHGAQAFEEQLATAYRARTEDNATVDF